jgi:type II secretory pathway pseudopilin PulG
MIEILIVIGVLVVLGTIVLLGMRHITGQNKGQQTRLTLQNLRTMLAEFENATRLSKGPNNWPWLNDSGGRISVQKNPPSPTFPAPLAPDFWRCPFFSDTEAVVPSPDPMDAPGSVASESGGPVDPRNVVRNGGRQIALTQLAMNSIYSVPVNRTSMQNMKPEQFFTPRWVMGQMPSPGGDRVLLTTDESTEPVFYQIGSRVETEDGVFRCHVEHQASSPPTPGSQWEIEGQEPAGRAKSSASPILLDAWNNPILFVPASGLRVRKLNGETKLDPTKAGQTFVIVSPEGSAEAPQMPGIPGKLLRPGKPFFASAGPDGNFATGDDNIYSFEE